jgi:hypothetical protein
MTSGRCLPRKGEFMKFRGKAVTGASLLTILGVVCFTTVLVGATALILLSNSTVPATTNLQNPLVATEQGTGDHSTGLPAWTSANEVAGNAYTYTDGLKIAAAASNSYAGTYDIHISIACPEGISDASLISVAYEGSGEYTPLTGGVISDNTWTATYHVDATAPTAGTPTDYNFEITLGATVPVGEYTIVYQAVPAAV